MKKISGLIFGLLIMTIMAFSQDAIISVNGTLVDDSTGAYVPNYEVQVMIGDSLAGGGYYQLLTDDQGYYHIDSVPTTGYGLVEVIVFDCNDIAQIQEDWIDPGIYNYTFDFSICVDNGQQGDCENYFWFETNDYLTFTFYGASYPFPADTYFWDFGDGTTGTGEQVTHTFDPNIGFSVVVGLTTVTFNPVTGDSCSAYSEQEIWLGGGTGSDCINWFSYTALTNESMKFFAFSEPYPAVEYLWDFGDGTTGEGEEIVHQFDPNLGDVFLVSLTTFIIDSIGDTCTAFSQQEVLVFNGGGNGDCDNFFWFESYDFITYSFFGESIPVEADNYFWDFGDGTTGHGKQVSHTYNPNIQGSAVVSLTTVVVDSITGDSCIAQSEYEIWIGGTPGGDCETWFVYETYDNLTYSFHAESYPVQADEYYWDFGDGTTGQGQNIDHTFDPNTSDIYYVSLTAVSLDPVSGDSCIAQYGEEIWIGGNPGGDCENFFWYESTGNYTYSFTGESFPYPAGFYHWDFGDGTTAQGQNVTHTFNPSTGSTFTVCLTTYANNPSMDSCIAVSCQEINLGGQAGMQLTGTVYLADSMPADYALVGLFGMDNGGSFIYDFVMTEPMTGSYFFDNVPEGNYYLLASLTPQSPDFTNYFPTYYGNAIFWFNATLITLGTPSNPYNINLVPIGNYGTGPGEIQGVVMIGSGKGNPANNVTVLIMDENENPIKYINTNEQGVFTFQDLELGTYKVKVEIPGKSSEIATLTLTDQSQIANIEFIVEGSGVILSADKGFDKYTFAGELFPNPVTDHACLRLTPAHPVNVTVSIYNYTGQIVLTESYNLIKGDNMITLNTADFKAGVYHIKITGEDGSALIKKLVKTK